MQIVFKAEFEDKTVLVKGLDIASEVIKTVSVDQINSIIDNAISKLSIAVKEKIHG